MCERDQIIERIKKLQEHTVENGATEAEAIAFALKAQKMIADNDVKQWELHKTEIRDVIEEQATVDTHRTWRGWLAKAIADNFRCHVVTRFTCEEYDRKRKAHIVFIGYECDAKAAAMVFDRLYEVGDKLAKEYRKQNRTERDAYENFVAGFVNGVKKELEKQCEALMLVCPQDVQEYYDNMQKRSARRDRYFRYNEAAQTAGNDAGRDALRAQRMDDSSNNGYLLQSA